MDWKARVSHVDWWFEIITQGDLTTFSWPIICVVIFKVIFSHQMQKIAHCERNLCRVE